MTDAVDRRDELADELDAAGYEVLDTFGELRGGPPRIALGLDEVTVEGERFTDVELTVAVTDSDVRAETLSVTDADGDLADDQRAVLDEVAEEKVPGPQMTLWNYAPGSADDDVAEVLEEIRTLADADAAT